MGLPEKHEGADLIRTSRLSSDFIRKHLDIINTPIRLDVDPCANDMISGWTPEEVACGRRLVLLVVSREAHAHIRIQARPVPPNSVPPHDKHLIISCIRWAEKDSYVVTSVDVLLVLEYLVGELFSIEEKSRIRRNLQFLKPCTVTRGDNSRLFNLLMSMENPRPRNIEKDLKVFKWTDLFVAVKKVLSKYSTNPHVIAGSNFELEFPNMKTQLGAVEHQLPLHQYPLSYPTLSLRGSNGAIRTEFTPSWSYAKLPRVAPGPSTGVPGTQSSSARPRQAFPRPGLVPASWYPRRNGLDTFATHQPQPLPVCG